MNHRAAAPGHVVLLLRNPDREGGHEAATCANVAQGLARLLGYDFAGRFDASLRYDAPLYFVPDETLLAATARAVGIFTDRDLFGGVVPHAFAATKVITHPLVDAAVFAPEGWSHALPEMLSGVVLHGFSVFSKHDARRACADVLACGDARLKPAHGIGGGGEVRLASMRELEAALEAFDEADLEAGLVIEQDLDDVATYSVGEVRLGEMHIAYYGTQRLTINHRGHQVYGGSDLVIVRGDLRELWGMQLDPVIRQVVDQARLYDEAASRAFPDLFASRRNYDVARGRAADGRICSGVLEQSWRIGGASPAEVVALETFEADERLRVVRASTHEVYGLTSTPPGSTVFFRGIDPQVGALTKYCVIDHGY